MKNITMFTLFSGYESQMMGLLNAVKKFNNRFKAELVGWCEIDKAARLVHNLVFPEYADRCYPDVREIDWNKVSDFDILFYSSPCQSVSRAGVHGGIEKDSETKSSLIWEVERAIAVKRPKWLILENVEGLLDPKFMNDYLLWTRTISSYGYKSVFKVLCAADFGIPQNRRRVFLISKRIDKDEDFNFEWPSKLQEMPKPETLLSDRVDDDYYLSKEETDTFVDLIKNATYGYTSSIDASAGYPTKILTSQLDKRISVMVSPLCKNGAIPTLMTSIQGGNLTSLTGCRREKAPCVIEVWTGKKGLQPQSLKSQKVSCQQVKAERECADRERILKLINSLKDGQYLRIRRLTPEECFRFMGVEQFYINRILNPYETLEKECYTEEQITRLMTIDGRKCKTSDYSLYGRVGNSIVVNVLTAIFSAIIEQFPDSFDDVYETSPEELRAARKRESQRKYYEKHKEEIRRKSREYHKQQRANKKNQ